MHSKTYTPSELATPELAAAIRHHNHLYFVKNTPEITDAEFDRLVAELRAREPTHPLLQEVGAPQVTLADPEKVVHQKPMLSLEKCTSPDEFESWLRGICATLTGRPNNPKSLTAEMVTEWARNSPESFLVLTPKIDGLACAIHYDADGQLQLAATRGDGQVGENVTEAIRQLPDVPAKLQVPGPVELRGEVYLPLSAFAPVADQYANPRNLAAGILKAKDNPALPRHSLRFFAYDVLGPDLPTEHEKLTFVKKQGFTPAHSDRIRAHEAQATYEKWVERRPDEDFEADGVVLKLDDVALYQRLGLTAHHPRGAIAWKFVAESGLTVLREIEWSVARTGTITPVAIVDPVQLSGAAVTRATLHNVSNLRRLGLKIGDTVELVRRGGVIPHVENSRGGGSLDIHPPELCPGCGSPTRLEESFNKTTQKTTEILLCTTPERCTVTRQKQLLHFCAALELDGFGEKIVELLLSSGLVTDAADLYTLQLGDLLELPRLGQLSAQKLLAEVERAKNVDLAVFLRALGIDSLGKHAAAILANRWDLPQIRQLTVAEMAELHSLGEITAEQIVAGLQTHAELIDKLLTFINLTRNKQQESEGPLKGEIVVFTGTLTRMKRADAQAQVVKLGGLAGDSVTGETTILVVGQDELESPTPSSKLKKARKLQEMTQKSEVRPRPEILLEGDFWQTVEQRGVERKAGVST